MKKLTLFALSTCLAFASCEELDDKLNADTNNFLKITIDGGTEIHFDHEQMEGRIISAQQNEDNREVFVVETTNTQPNFWVQFRADIPAGSTQPILAALPGDDASLTYNGKTYKLYNGTVNLDHFDLESFGYTEGVFTVHLNNIADASETVSVSGSFNASNYTQ